MDPSLRLTTLRLSENAYVCTLSGELDVSTADAAGAALDQIERDGARYVVIDLLGLTFLDSAGIGLLMASARRLRSGDGELRLVVDDPRVVRMLEITGISRQFRLDRTLSDAVTDLTTQVLSYD